MGNNKILNHTQVEADSSSTDIHHPKAFQDFVLQSYALKNPHVKIWKERALLGG